MKRKHQPAARGLCAAGRQNVIRSVCLILLTAGTAWQAFPQRGIITTYAGGGRNSTAALSAEVVTPVSAAVDTSGNIYIAAYEMQQVFRVGRSGNFTLVAGNGTPGFGGDDGPATSASLRWPYGVAVDAQGNVFIADSSNNRVRRVDAATGIITTVVGDGSWGFSGDGGLATSASLWWPRGVAVDAHGNLFIADTANDRVRRVDAVTGDISTVAGDGNEGYSGDGGPATGAELGSPEGVAVYGSGSSQVIYIADTGNSCVRRVDASGNITSFVGAGSCASDLQHLCYPTAVAVDNAGDLFVADTDNNRVVGVPVGTYYPVLEAGNGVMGFSGDGGLATSASLTWPEGVAVDANGNLSIADCYNNRIREVASGIINTVAGGGSGGDGGAATRATTVGPWAVATDWRGDLFVADRFEYRIRRVNNANRIITTAAGNGDWGYSGDGGPATSATLDPPEGVAADARADLFIADTFNNRIRRVDAATGEIATVAGDGSYGYSGDGGPATNASLSWPYGVAVDVDGNLFIADNGNCRIRRLDGTTGIITTVAGDGNCGFGGDGGPATNAELDYPEGVAVDAQDNLFIADSVNSRIRRVGAKTGDISTVAGNGNWGYSGDGGLATSASLAGPYGVAVDAQGNLFIADSGNDRIRRVDGTTGIIATVAGDGNSGLSGDGGLATRASLDLPTGVAVDQWGRLFIADYYNNKVREVPLPPFAALSTNKLVFSTQAVGTTSKPQVVTLTNTGIWTLTISSFAIDGTDARDFALSPLGTSTGGADADNACGSSLEPAARCQISVTFTPKAAGKRTATLTITDDAPDSPQTVALSGTGCVGACSFEP